MSDRTDRFRAVWDALSEEDRRFLIRLVFPSTRAIEQVVLLFERGHCPAHTGRIIEGPHARSIEFAAWRYRNGGMAEWEH